LHFIKDRFPKQRRSKLSPREDGPFRFLKRINNNDYRQELLDEYEVNATFNVIDLIPFAGRIDDEANPLYSRSNSFQEKENEDIHLADKKN